MSSLLKTDLKGNSKRIVLATMVTMLMSGCVTTVEPWEREILAKKSMAWEPDGMQSAFKQHVYTSKEATTGGTSTTGGGCGCN